LTKNCPITIIFGTLITQTIGHPKQVIRNSQTNYEVFVLVLYRIKTTDSDDVGSQSEWHIILILHVKSRPVMKHGRSVRRDVDLSSSNTCATYKRRRL